MDKLPGMIRPELQALPHQSSFLVRQAEYVSNQRKHLAVVRKMYQIRFPDEDASNMTLQQLRGREGSRVRSAYRKCAKEYGVEWNGRDYDPEHFETGDPVNQALSAGCACLYGLAHAVIMALGLSPGLGFIHVGHDCSLVYDIADLYKAETVIPTAFQVAADAPDDLPAVMRRKVRDAMVSNHILERMVHDIRWLFQKEDQEEKEDMVSDCSPKIRGDLSKWLCEINTGVFVGNVSSRVRDEIWDRVCNNIKNGQATMVFSAQGEQKMDFRVHNTSWEPVDFDGIKLMRRPFLEKRNVQNDVTERKESKSRAERFLIADRMKRAQAKKHFQEGYVVLDVETTGTSLHSDEIIEIGALRVEAGIPTKEFSTLVQCEKKIPKEVQMLTGLTNCDLDDNGKPLKQALEELFVFAGEHIIIGHNVTFDVTIQYLHSYEQKSIPDQLR